MNLTREDRALASATFRRLLGIDEVAYAGIVIRSRNFYLEDRKKQYWQLTATFKSWYYKQFSKAICKSMLENGIAFDQEDLSEHSLSRLKSSMVNETCLIHKYSPARSYIEDIEKELERLMEPANNEINKLLNNTEHE